ncbi:MAG: AAA family ATPase [Chloroflexota bacterium]|nr:AAA family ATPase [Chloroflexota bacterium]
MSALSIDLEFVDAEGRVPQGARAALAESGITLAVQSVSLDAILARPQGTCPHAVVLDVSVCAGEPALAVRQILAHCPEAVIIVTGAGAPASAISRAVSAGARGFLLKPYQAADLVATVRDAYENAQALGRARPAHTTARRGRLIPVYSPKGGVGCTTIATNLAVALASKGRSVALVDLDLQFGDVGSVLDLKSANSIADLLAQPEITQELVNDTFVTHASGVRVLLAPENLSVVETIDPADAVALLKKLTALFDYVVCDLWSSLEELSIQTMRAADQVVLVTTPELPALRNVQRVVTATRDDLHLDEKALFVGNRLPGKGSLSSEEILRAFGRPFVATFPSEGVGVTEAINRGLSFFDSRVNPRIAKHYLTFADVVVGKLEGKVQAQQAPATR